MTRILSWNILHGGGSRIPDILDVIASHEPDIVTLQEMRRGKGEAALRAGLEDIGLTDIYIPDTNEARENTILVAARTSFEAQRWPDDNGHIAAFSAKESADPSVSCAVGPANR